VGVSAGPVVPALVAASGRNATLRFLDFFATQIENDNTRAAYLRAAREFLAWCGGQKMGLLADIQPVHVAAWIKQSKLTHSVPTVKLRPGCDPPPVRLAGYGSRHANQSSFVGAGTAPCGAQGQNARARCG
jgi:hypothetical protein